MNHAHFLFSRTLTFKDIADHVIKDRDAARQKRRRILAQHE